MSTVLGEHGTIHYPKRRDCFQFDEDVASHFDEMAVRSLPLYNEVHRLHVSMLADRLVPEAVIADIGSSTGKTFRAIEAAKGMSLMDSGIAAYAVDSSQPMMARLAKEFPSVVTYSFNVQDMPDLPCPVDIMFAYYTLQFIPANERAKALVWMARNIKPHGVLVLGQKDDVTDAPFALAMEQEYYKFRRDNGYTQQEIDAKTAALKNAMWPVRTDHLTAELDTVGFDAVETTRWLQFSTVIAEKRG